MAKIEAGPEAIEVVVGSKPKTSGWLKAKSDHRKPWGFSTIFNLYHM
jgi:hypothetical protein